MDDIIQKALKRREELQSELAELDQFIDTYKRLTAMPTAASAPVATAAAYKAVVDNRIGMLAPLFARRRGAPQNFADICERIINEAGMPMTRTRLVEAIERQGLVIPSTDKPRYIGTILWRHRDRFVNLTDHGYWLRNRTCAFAHYHPGSKEGVDEEAPEPDEGGQYTFGQRG